LAFDYSGLLLVADTLITNFGRPITLRRNSRTPDDSNKPWAIRSDSAEDIQAIAAIGVWIGSKSETFDSVTAGVGVGLSNVQQKSSRVLIQALDTLPEEMGREWKVDDGDQTYEVLSAQPVKPGATLLYYDLEVKL
jgi:hypothetical protein